MILPKKFIPKIIVIDLNDPCYLNCSFCPKTKDTVFTKNSFLKIKILLDYFISFGIESFEITPTIGDSINNPYLIQILDYLLHYNKKVFMFTSLVGNIKDLKTIINRPNFYLVISTYGLTKNSFKKHTNVNKYSNFIMNLLFVLNNFKPKDNNYIIIRNRFDNKKDSILFKSLINKYQSDNIFFELYHPDITSTKDSSTKDSSVKFCCNFLINFGCDINGDIRFCNYAFGAPIIGNIFKDNLNDILNNYFQKYLNNSFCSSCILFDEVDLEGKENNYKNNYILSYSFKSFLNNKKINIGLVNIKKEDYAIN